jgi:hypothetical protein
MGVAEVAGDSLAIAARGGSQEAWELCSIVPAAGDSPWGHGVTWLEVMEHIALKLSWVNPGTLQFHDNHRFLVPSGSR